MRERREWWKEAVFYQIYPRSFRDTDGDGVGDLRGILEKLDYLSQLGVTALWICPVYRSPMDDNGYDISDYYHIDPLFGSDEDMEELLREAGRRNIKIIMDLIANHCSDEHVWFRRAADPDCEEAGYFYFRRTPDGTPPNNWRSNFGGPAWDRLPDGRWYLHTFGKKQPDLNWENPALREKLYAMVNWWLDKGVAGFRVDAITFIKKDTSFASREAPEGGLYPIESFENYPGIGGFLTELRQKAFGRFGCVTVAEAPGVPYEQLPDYAGENGYFSMIFDFNWDHLPSGPKTSEAVLNEWRDRIFTSQERMQEVGWSPVFLENHDQARCPNKFLPAGADPHGVTMLATLYFLLRGTPFLYQGQELGMTNCPMEGIGDYRDTMAVSRYAEGLAQGKPPEELLAALQEDGRDHARTPFQWDDGPNAGFTEGTPWIRLNPDYTTRNVRAEERDPDSVLHYYRRLIRLRRREADVLVYGSFAPCCTEYGGLCCYLRSGGGRTVAVFCNLTGEERQLRAPVALGELLIGNYPTVERGEGTLLTLRPYQSAAFLAAGDTFGGEKG